MFEHLINNAEKFRNSVININKKIQELEIACNLFRNRDDLRKSFYIEQAKLNDLYRGIY